MAIPMVIRINHLFMMTEAQRISVTAHVTEAYKKAKREGVPFVVGEHCEVLWPVEKWEHDVHTTPKAACDFTTLVKEHEAKGWQIASMAYHPGPIVFKRPAGDEPTEPA